MTITSLVVCSSKEIVPSHLNAAILECSAEAIALRGSFSLALSGGSLVSFLSSLKDNTALVGDPKFENWHVILADERCVPLSDPESNLGGLQDKFLSTVPIPTSQIHGINQGKIEGSAEDMALDYEEAVRGVLEKTGGSLDLAVLGFGPDGHTCSLFPNHPLLQEDKRWVAAIEDSPKPPPKRITLTFPLLNQHTRHVLFCGAGSSKSPILREVFAAVGPETTDYQLTLLTGGKKYTVSMASPPPYPCAMVLPEGDASSVTWIVDDDAMEGIPVATSSS